VNHPALVKTSDQPSFSSANFSPFTSAEALRASDIRAVSNLNLQPNPRCGTVKKITTSSYRDFVGATQKKKIKQATKSKTNRLASNSLLGQKYYRNNKYQNQYNKPNNIQITKHIIITMKNNQGRNNKSKSYK